MCLCKPVLVGSNQRLQCCTMPASNRDVSLDVIFNNKANAQGLNLKSNCQNATNTLFPKMTLILGCGFVWVFFL